MTTPTTTVGLLATVLATLYPTWSISRDGTDDRAEGTFPRITLKESISRVRMSASAVRMPRMSELLQIDVWQKREDGFPPEDTTVRPTIEKALDALVPTVIQPGGTVYRMTADGPGMHDYDATTNVVHDAFTVRCVVQLLATDPAFS